MCLNFRRFGVLSLALAIGLAGGALAVTLGLPLCVAGWGVDPAFGSASLLSSGSVNRLLGFFSSGSVKHFQNLPFPNSNTPIQDHHLDGQLQRPESSILLPEQTPTPGPSVLL